MLEACQQQALSLIIIIILSKSGRGPCGGGGAVATVLEVDQNHANCSDIVGTPYCTIGAAVGDASSSDTVNVASGNYVENVLIDKNDFSLLSMDGKETTTIEGVSNDTPLALGAVQIKGTTGVTIGGPDKGFTIVGIDNGNPAVENAAIYVQSNNADLTIEDNVIVAKGEAGLLSEFGATNSNFTIINNEFSGQSFEGPSPAECGFANQFSAPNVPRQLVTIGGGSGGGSTSDIVFTNNLVNGTAGGPVANCNPPVNEQGNTLVTVDAVGATISDNVFEGTTGRYSTSLRTRGPDTLISGNSFSKVGLRPVACHVFVQEIDYDLQTVFDANTFSPPAFIPPPLTGSSTTGSICPAPDNDGDGVADDLDVCPNSTLDGITMLEPNSYALNDFNTLAFEVGPNQDQSIVYNLDITEGCTCAQIAEHLGVGMGHIKHGCSAGIMQMFTGLQNNPDRKAGIGQKQ